MILCVTLNPCLDKTLTVPRWRPGDFVRGAHIKLVTGGKGNNVARALKGLGRLAAPVCFLGGSIGAKCAKLLREQDGLEAVVIPVQSETREILTLHCEVGVPDTAFFDPDPDVTVEETQDLLNTVGRLASSGGVEAIALCGSSPAAATHGVFAELARLGQAHSLPVFVDTYGPALDAFPSLAPTVIKVNRREAAGRLGKTDPGDQDLIDLLKCWIENGVEIAIITAGEAPSWCGFAGALYRVVPPSIKVVNPVGSGDSLLAGLIDGRLAGLSHLASLRRGFACAAANAMVWDAGALDRQTVAELEPTIAIDLVSAFNR